MPGVEKIGKTHQSTTKKHSNRFPFSTISNHQRLECHPEHYFLQQPNNNNNNSFSSTKLQVVDCSQPKVLAFYEGFKAAISSGRCTAAEEPDRGTSVETTRRWRRRRQRRTAVGGGDERGKREYGRGLGSGWPV